MTPTQREAAERAIAWHQAMADEPKRNEAKRCKHQLTAALLRELAAEPVQEPVAWHVCSVNSDGSLSLEFAAPWEELAHEHINDAILDDIDDGAESWVVRPVYTHPPQQRKPLTDEQVYEAISDQVFWATSRNFILRLVRDVERAHGITGEPT